MHQLVPTAQPMNRPGHVIPTPTPVHNNPIPTPIPHVQRQEHIGAPVLVIMHETSSGQSENPLFKGF